VSIISYPYYNMPRLTCPALAKTKVAPKPKDLTNEEVVKLMAEYKDPPAVKVPIFTFKIICFFV